MPRIIPGLWFDPRPGGGQLRVSVVPSSAKRAIADEGEAALSWQVVPALVSEALGDPGAERGQRAVRAVSAREDLDLAALRAAADGASS